MFASVCQMVCSGRSIFRELINLLSSFTLDRSHVSVRERGRREKSAAGDQQNSSKEEEATTTAAVPSEKKDRVTRHFQMVKSLFLSFFPRPLWHPHLLHFDQSEILSFGSVFCCSVIASPPTPPIRTAIVLTPPLPFCTRMCCPSSVCVWFVDSFSFWLPVAPSLEGGRPVSDPLSEGEEGKRRIYKKFLSPSPSIIGHPLLGDVNLSPTNPASYSGSGGSHNGSLPFTSQPTPFFGRDAAAASLGQSCNHVFPLPKKSCLLFIDRKRTL